MMYQYAITLVPSGTNRSTNGLAKAIGSTLCTYVIQETRSPGIGSTVRSLKPIYMMQCILYETMKIFKKK